MMINDRLANAWTELETSWMKSLEYALECQHIYDAKVSAYLSDEADVADLPTYEEQARLADLWFEVILNRSQANDFVSSNCPLPNQGHLPEFGNVMSILSN
jgi:hypothetical protein